MSDQFVILVDNYGQPYIAHHGIKGQRWGIRRKIHKKNSKKNVNNKKATKALIILGATVVTGAVAAYGLNKLSINRLSKEDIARGKRCLRIASGFKNTGLELEKMSRPIARWKNEFYESAKKYEMEADKYMRRARSKNYSLSDKASALRRVGKTIH